MSKDGIFRVEGEVVEVLPNANFKVKLENGMEILSHIAGRLRQYEIRIVMGDSVEVEVSTYDLTRGRIVKRK